MDQQTEQVTFESFTLPEFLLKSLERLQITSPTPIQAQSIPVAMEGKDLLATAQTGSGKTFAFLLPLLNKLVQTQTDTALVLVPTRELAQQVQENIKKLLTDTQPVQAKHKLYSTALIGGEPIGKQLAQLKRKPRIIVGTPGRICDHISRGSLKLQNTFFLVLDETDRMLDMGFSDDLETILNQLPELRQTLMYSATMPTNIAKLSQKYLKNPERVSIGSAQTPTASIKQEFVHTPSNDKFPRLLEQLEQREGSVIVFVKTKRGAEELADMLKQQNHSADAIHGDLHQRKRERVINSFRNKRSRIMVATDVAARGLDIPHIEHVVNFDLPECPEDYIHRIGRTGRAGAEGSALSFISPDEQRKWRAINKFMNTGDSDGRQPSKGGGSKFGGRRGQSRFSDRNGPRSPQQEGGYGRRRTRDSFSPAPRSRDTSSENSFESSSEGRSFGGRRQNRFADGQGGQRAGRNSENFNERGATERSGFGAPQRRYFGSEGAQRPRKGPFQERAHNRSRERMPEREFGNSYGRREQNGPRGNTRGQGFSKQPNRREEFSFDFE